MSEEHIDRANCKACYGWDFPYPCACGKGWVHEDYLDEDEDNVWTRTFCSNPDCEEELE